MKVRPRILPVLFIAAAVLAVGCGPVKKRPPAVLVFGCTGVVDTFAVPAGVTLMAVSATGAEGGRGAAPDNLAAPGPGGRGDIRINVTPGEVFQFVVGCRGGDGTAGTGGAGGFGAGSGGDGGDAAAAGGGGGGSSALLRGGAPVVVGGGGGGAGASNDGAGGGGAGGETALNFTGVMGADGCAAIGGGGATLSDVGLGGMGDTNGLAGAGASGGAGGPGPTFGGGGGGGGFFGGGGGGGDNSCSAAGGGGGSGVGRQLAPSGYGGKTGDGEIIISY